MFTSKGKLICDPMFLRKSTAPAPWWMILDCCPGIVDYYHDWFQRQFGIKLLKPSWGSHLSVVRGESPPEAFQSLWRAREGEEVEFSYDHALQGNSEYFWIDVYCDEVLNIRQSLGLPRKPAFDLHITVGKLPMEYRNLNLRFFD